VTALRRPSPWASRGATALRQRWRSQTLWAPPQPQAEVRPDTLSLITTVKPASASLPCCTAFSRGSVVMPSDARSRPQMDCNSWTSFDVWLLIAQVLAGLSRGRRRCCPCWKRRPPAGRTPHLQHPQQLERRRKTCIRPLTLRHQLMAAQRLGIRMMLAALQAARQQQGCRVMVCGGHHCSQTPPQQQLTCSDSRLRRQLCEYDMMGSVRQRTPSTAM
jgi:hypothetical protein